MSPAEVASLRSRLWDVELRPIAVYTVEAGRRLGHDKPGKHPFGKGWTEAARRDPPAAVTDPPQPDALNTGILCDGLRAIDIDIDDPDLASRCTEIARETLGEAPTRWRANSSRRLLLYRAAAGEPPKRSVSSNHGKLEVLGKGQQFVAFGDHESGAVLQWTGDAPGSVLRDSIPAVTEEQITEYLARCAPFIGAKPPSPGNGEDHQPGEPQAELLRIAAALNAIPNNGPADWEWWNYRGMALYAATGGSAAGFALFDTWSSRNRGYDENLTRKRWRDYRRSPPTTVGAGTIFYLAMQNGWRDPQPEDDHGYIKALEDAARAAWARPNPRQCRRATDREAAFPREPRWRERLLKNDKGKIIGCLANTITALRHAPEWDDRLWFDKFHNRAVLRGVPPWSNKSVDDEPWSDLFDNLTVNWMHHHGIMISAEIAGRAVWTVAHDQWFHPVRAYLERCRRAWDGQKRVGNWPTTYLGTPTTPYSQAVGQRWLISLVARVEEPGCKADSALVLEGPQAMLKSEILRKLGSPWFTDDMGGSQLGSKDAAIQVSGVWIIELAELDQYTTGRDVAKTKSFMSRMTDRFRPPYGTHPIPQPRQCCFGCTTNKTEYLPDETGNRRWWPLECVKIALARLEADRDQLLGEAVALYEAGEPWWLDTQELNAVAGVEQDKRYLPDSWDALISDYVDQPTEEREDARGKKTTVTLPPLESVSVPDILEEVLGLPPALWGQREENRVAKSLRKLGWKRKQKRISGDREWRYFRPRAEAT